MDQSALMEKAGEFSTSLDPAYVIVAVLAGILGMWFCGKGKNEAQLSYILAGVGLCIVPYFVTTLWLLITICLAMTAAPYVWLRHTGQL